MMRTQRQPSTASLEVGPTAEVVSAFLEHLVDPLLPFKPSATPSLSNQQRVAGQLKAVVLLHNYFQRKQHSQAEYLDFMSFCKLAVSLRPTLETYMSSTKRSGSTDSNGLESQFSVTENAIMDACNIASSLDVLKDVPDVEGWPVSKVAVFLVDHAKKNCFLLFGSLTEGVWSIIEKSVEHSVESSENQVEGKDLHKKKRRKRQNTGDWSSDGSVFDQLAFSAVKEAKGIDRSDLKVLDRHVTYSVSKERTSAWFYIMQCQSTNQDFEVSVRDTIESLQGPLVKRSFASWTLTQVIEYYHVLPYARFISRWFSREFGADVEIENEVGTEMESDDTCVTENLSDKIHTEGSDDYFHGPESPNKLALDLSGSPKAETLFQESGKDQTMDIIGNCSQKAEASSGREAKRSSNDYKTRCGANPEDQKVNITSSSHYVNREVDDLNVPLSSCEKLLSGSGKNFISVSQVSSNDGSIKETEQHILMEVDQDRTSTIPVGDVNSSQRSGNEGKLFVKSGDVPENCDEHRVCKSNPVDLCNRKDLPLDSVCLNAENTQNICAPFINEVSTTKDESQEIPDERFTMEKDLEGGKTDSDGERNPLLSYVRQDLQLESGSPVVENTQKKGAPNNEVSATVVSQLDGTEAEERLTTEKDSKGGKTDSKMQKDDPISDENSMSFPLVEGVDNSPVNCPKDADEITNPKRVIVYNLKRKRSKSHDTHASAGCEIAEMETAQILKSAVTECRDELANNSSAINSSYQYGPPVNGPALKPVETRRISFFEKLTSLWCSKENDLSQATMKVLLKRRGELSLQLREIEDQIALCEQSIQKILHGAEDNMVLKIDTVVDYCNSTLEEKSEVQCNSHILPVDLKTYQLSSSKSLPKSAPLLRPRQELDDICHENYWVLPRYSISGSDGNFTATVSLKEKKFQFSCDGDCCSSPPEAKESAAAKMIAKLRLMAAGQAG